jgi:hypothetical protein
VDNTKSSAPEHHSRPEVLSRRAHRLLSVLLSSCAECGTRDAEYYVSAPGGHLAFMEGDELCESCGINHGIL